jgi:hypothetical protein
MQSLVSVIFFEMLLHSLNESWQRERFSLNWLLHSFLHALKISAWPELMALAAYKLVKRIMHNSKIFQNFMIVEVPFAYKMIMEV